MNIFEVDSKGLAKIAERRGKAFVLYELLQNAWDTDATLVTILFEPVPGKPLASLYVEDDHPDGFKNLAHAWTLFAESEKKDDARKRGRFNLGEKLVLSLCQEAKIITTTGGVRFDKDGRHTLRQKREKGSLFEALIRMTRTEYDEALTAVQRVLVPEGVGTFINGVRLPTRKSVGSETVTLPTEIADEEGYLRRRQRETRVLMYKPMPDEVGTLYEMGIPVMETGDKWHVDVQQKVPLTLERDGVHPSYLRAVRAATLNTLYREIKTEEEAAAPWVRDALAHDSMVEQTVRGVLDTRYGKDRVVYDPSDLEANHIAASKGMKVIHGASLSADEWANVRRFEAAKPAGQVTPSPKPFHPGGRALKLLEPWTPAVTNVVKYFQRVAIDLLGPNGQSAKEIQMLFGGVSLIVIVADDKKWEFNGAFRLNDERTPELVINYAKMRFAIERYDLRELNRFLIHELAHAFESNHLAEGFHDACCRLGAKLVHLALTNPTMFAEVRG